MFVVYHKHADTHGGQKRVPYALEIELQMFVSSAAWVLGSELRFSTR